MYTKLIATLICLSCFCVSGYSEPDDVTEGLVTHYAFESNFDDSSDSLNHGIETGGVTFDEGVVGLAASFDGIDDIVEATNQPFVDGPFTLSLWVYRFSYTGPNGDLLRANEPSDPGGYALYWETGRLFFRLHTAESEFTDVTIAPPPLLTWVHLAVTYDFSQLKLFLNGQLVDSAEVSGSIWYINSPLTIAGDGSLVHGLMDDLRAYNRALAEFEIWDLYDLGDTVSSSLTCTPSSGTVPFLTDITASLTNRNHQYTRRVAGRIDVDLSGGTSFSNWRAGYTNLAPGETYAAHLALTIPSLLSVIGDNTFTLFAEDVTPAPYNQPPHPASGDTDTSVCIVTGVAP